MDNKAPQYQRAVTPTLENVGSGMVRGKVLSYSSNVRSRYVKTTAPVASASEKVSANTALPPSGVNGLVRGNSLISPRGSILQVNGSGAGQDMNIQGRSTKATNGVAATNFRANEPTAAALEQASANSNLPRYDLVPLNDELPTDGVIFARIRNQPESLVVFRTPEERLRNPERLNLDRRQLEICPLLEQEQRLRLLNFQNNNIRTIQNLENLPNLIFLDLYNNKITSLEGPLSSVKGLRVLMAGKNKITTIANLTPLRKLDVLDLHSNDIGTIEGLDGLADLRVLNLAGNSITTVNNLSSLVSLTELNLRRNNIDCVSGLNKLPALQRVFLSHNQIRTVGDIQCLFEVAYLIELSLDGNPLSEGDPLRYRNTIILGMAGLRHLDLKRITDEERVAVAAAQAGSLAAERDHSVHSEEAAAPPVGSPQKREGNGRTLALEPPVEVPLPTVPKAPEAIPAAPGDATPTRSGGSRPHTAGLNVKKATASSIVEDPPPDRLQHIDKSASGEEYGNIKRASPFDPTGAAETNNVGLSPAKPVAQGLAAMARAGRISAAQSLFDLEIIGPDEKALIAVGDAWEWTQSRRMLSNVSEASLFHMKRDTILGKFTAAHLAAMPALRSLRLVNNDFHSLKNVDFIPEMFGSTIEHLVIKDSPINSTASSLLRCYIVATMPNIVSFNDVEVSEEERQNAEAVYLPLTRLKQAEVPLFVQKHSGASPHNNGRFANLKANKAGPGSNTITLSALLKNNSSATGSALKDRKYVPNYVVSSKNMRAAAAWEEQQGLSPGCEFAQSALFHRRVNADFNTAFENVVQSIILETLEGYRSQHRS